ncbi:hypothetical protein C0989_003744 [Termitomyces sp. Mn162]|nr:hypothetical protein C0989_003744 [Termitomyces sp. Mn162]
MAPRVLESVLVSEDAQSYENENVHAIYDEIASHFSSTRYKPWPVISAFMSSLSTGWVGLDAGTGNGKYLPLPLDRPTDIFTVGLDRSIKLLRIARIAGESQQIREVVWGDILGHGWRSGVFRLIKSVSPRHGRILIYVWAIEQDELSKRKVIADDESNSNKKGKDVIVPWILASQKDAHKDSTGPQVFNRYYHMFAKGELSGLVHDAARGLGIGVGPPHESLSSKRGVEIIQDDWERSNYYVELKCWEISGPLN